jgi:hypothetical protein
MLVSRGSEGKRNGVKLCMIGFGVVFDTRAALRHTLTPSRKLREAETAKL